MVTRIPSQRSEAVPVPKIPRPQSGIRPPRPSSCHVRPRRRCYDGDQRSGALPEAWGLTRLAPPVQIGPLTCAHYPEEAGPGPGLAGHLHPRIDLRRGPDRLRLPCFWLRGEQLTLPAFAWFASHSAITREPGDRVFAIADDEVLELVPDRAERSPAGRGRARH